MARTEHAGAFGHTALLTRAVESGVTKEKTDDKEKVGEWGDGGRQEGET